MTGLTERPGWRTRALQLWERIFLDHPWWVLLVTALCCAASTWYTARDLKLNTDTASLLSTDLPYQQNRLRIEHAFPQDTHAVLLVVTAPTSEQGAATVSALADALRADSQHFSEAYAPEDNAFFAHHALLYQDVGALTAMAASLRGAQPLLRALAAEPRADRLIDLLAQTAQAERARNASGADDLYAQLAAGVERAAAGNPTPLSWQQILSGRDAPLPREHLLLATPVLDYSQLQPAAQAVDALHQIVARVRQSAGPDVQIRATGEVLLEHDEMRSLSESITVAGLVSLILVCATLLFAYRSLKLMFATFVTLTAGLALSMAFATAAVGHLNLISIAFAVLFIGMGDAYSSHFCLRYKELLAGGATPRAALRETMQSTGPSLALCTITAALGLYAFIPTDYEGVSELGIIAGTSLVIAMITTFTLLPTLLWVMPLKPAASWRPRGEVHLPLWLTDGPRRYARGIRIFTLLLAVGALVLMTRVTIDFNPVNLRDPNSESVQTFEALLKSKTNAPLTTVALAADAAEARDKAARFERLPEVERVVSVADFIPPDQPAKLALARQMRAAAGPALDIVAQGLHGELSLAALQRLEKALGSDGAAGHLRAVLANFLTTAADRPAPERIAMLAILREVWLGTFAPAVDHLRAALDPTSVTLTSLPPEIRDRWVSPEGIYRLEVFPREDLNDLERLRVFARATQAVDAGVSGLPATYLESMNEVLKAFAEAFAIALVASAVILLLLLRSWRATLLVLLPLLLASLFTAAATVLAGIPLNFANVIALPLLFGLGIDNGIHMVHRMEYLGRSSSNEPLLSSSEAEGVFYATLTTIFSFGSLAFIAHRGTASMGALLAIGLLITLACALFVLPAFGAGWFARAGARMRPSSNA